MEQFTLAVMINSGLRRATLTLSERSFGKAADPRKVVALVAASPAMSHHRSFAPEVSAEEQQRAQAEAARKLSFTKSREESSRLACERDVARAKQRGSRVFPIAATEALCARLVKRQCQC